MTEEVDEDVEIEFDFEQEMNGSEDDQVIVIPDDETVLEPVVQTPEAQTPPISLMILGMPLTLLIR